jgi:alkylated DNA nucleotide flippase Atl1
VLHVLSAMPDGVVVEYGRLARLAGVDPGYCRAFPRLLAQRGIAARAIPAKSATAAPRWNGDGLFDDEAGLHLPL